MPMFVPALLSPTLSVGGKRVGRVCFSKPRKSKARSRRKENAEGSIFSFLLSAFCFLLEQSSEMEVLIQDKDERGNHTIVIISGQMTAWCKVKMCSG